MKEVCGTCKYNRHSYDDHCKVEFYCGNKDSENYTVATFYDDSCDDWEEKDE